MIYKNFSRRKHTEVKDNSNSTSISTKKKESKVGRKMSEVATKTVTLLVFILLILLPLFSADLWINQPNSNSMLCSQILMIMDYPFNVRANLATLVYNPDDSTGPDNDQRSVLARLTSESISDYDNQALGPLLRIKFSNLVDYYHKPQYDLYRPDQMVSNYCVTQDNARIEVNQKDEYYDNVDSWLTLSRILYIYLVLIGGSYLFSYNTHSLVIGPIERMIDKVVALIEKPQIVKEEAFMEQEEKEFREHILKDNDLDKRKSEAEGNKLETEYLEKAISKIGVLLGVGLGEAGTELINTYLNKETDILNIANETKAIFGFCDIRNFTDATEVLQEEVMVFVNTIADIVHSIADGALGAANKNVGDAFLIVWRISLDDAILLNENDHLDISTVWTNLADLALYSLLTMHAEVGRANQLKKFVDNPKMKERIGKNYRIRLGFGLHYGWAIEGALGSHYKVDVTYLSPHVNMAAQLEGDTKKYGVPILISGDLHDMLSPFVQGYCRQIDYSMMDHGPTIRLFAPLISDKQVKYIDSKAIDRHILKTKERFYFKKVAKLEIFQGNLIGKSLFENSLPISFMSSHVNQDLGKTFKIAFDLFVSGDWSSAIHAFDKVLTIEPEDGPTMFLKNYMQQNDWTKPHGWQGYRHQALTGH